MRIMVWTLRGERVALDVDGATTTVAQVKSVVMARERVPVELQRLFFAGQLLDDDNAPVARYGVQNGSVVFLSLRLRDDAPPHRQEKRNVQTHLGPVTVKQAAEQQQHPVHVHDEDGGDRTIKRRKPAVSRRSLRKILSRVHLDVWTRHHDAKFLDLLQRHTAHYGRGAGDLTPDDWSCISVELNAATRSAFSVEELQRRLAEFQRELDAARRVRCHPRFEYDARRRVVVATEAEWKRYLLDNPEAAALEGRRSPRLGRLRAIFSGHSGGAEAREHGGAKRWLGELLRSFGLRCMF